MLTKPVDEIYFINKTYLWNIVVKNLFVEYLLLIKSICGISFINRTYLLISFVNKIFCGISVVNKIYLWNIFLTKIVSEYDQEIPQSQTADNPVAPRGRAAQPSRDTRKTNLSKATSSLFPIEMIAILEWT